MLLFEWDEGKRIRNLEKHGVDFAVVEQIFAGPTMEGPDNRHDYGEQRIGAYGLAENEVLFVIYTWRGNIRRIISARKTGNHERQAYFAGTVEYR